MPREKISEKYPPMLLVFCALVTLIISLLSDKDDDDED